MRFGFLGGTFDPIHNGHLHLARSLQEVKGLDKVYFCPTGKNPHKEGEESAPYEHRKAMVLLAIESEPSFELWEEEKREDSPNYTVDALEDITQKVPGEWYLLLGDDLISRFSEWKNPEKILQLATPLVGSRGENGNSNQLIQKKNIIKTPKVEISATNLRFRLKNGESIKGLVPAKVVDYIVANSVY